jgi:hypothetical protein
MLRGCHPGIPTPSCDEKALGGQGKQGDRRLIMPFSELVAIARLQGHPIRPKPGTRNRGESHTPWDLRVLDPKQDLRNL